MSALTKKIFLLLVPLAKTHYATFEPAEDRHRRALTGNGWKDQQTQAGEAARRQLIRSIAAHLMSRPDASVVFHFDGDTTWTQRSTCVTSAQFERLIRKPLIEVVRAALLKKGTTTSAAAAEALQVVARLLVMVPFYCIESWTYQNSPIAASLCLCARSSDCRVSMSAWVGAPADLDELERPWEHCCLKKSHNAALAESAYPASAVYELGQSFRAVVDEWRKCSQLLEWLTRTSSYAF